MPFTYLILFVCIALLSGVRGSIWKPNGTISESHYIRVTDRDGSTVFLKRLPVSGKHFGSCYEMKSDAQIATFCYPSINIIGVAKCGTSALYKVFEKNPDVLIANSNKEYCIRESGLFSYLRGFPSPPIAETRKFIVNGCIDSYVPAYVELQLMLHPRTTSIMIVRDIADREWASYNYWCSSIIDMDCVDASQWTKPGMYRSPELFHELVLSTEHVGSKQFRMKCATMNAWYSNWFQRLNASFGEPPLMLAMEAMSSAELLPKVLQRLEEYINNKFGSDLRLRHTDVLRVNGGDHHGATVEDKQPVDGVYKISGYKPMLPETRTFLVKCWKECALIAKITGFSYNCA